MVVALCLWTARPRSGWLIASIAAIGLLFTFTRAAFVALAGAFVAAALVGRRRWALGMLSLGLTRFR
jgi:hypothetical protein